MTASEHLIDLEPLQTRARELVHLARKAGAQAADVVVASSRSTGVDVRDGAVEDTSSAETDAFSLRVMIGQRSASVSAGRGGDGRALAERAVAMAKVSPENPHAALTPADRLATNWPDLDLEDATPIGRETMVEWARACEAAALAVPGIAKSIGGGFGRSVSGMVLATSEGFEGAYGATHVAGSVSVVAGEDDRMERDYDFDSRRHFEDLRDPAEIGRRAGERTARRVDPRTVESQSVPVLYDPRVARGLVGHLLEAMNGASVARGTSLFRDRLGEAVASTGVTIVDQPHIVRGPSSRPFDGEGMAVGDLLLIEDGRLNHFLLDGASARELGMEPNGRGSRSGSATSPSTTNTTMQAGSRSPEEMMRDIGTGFYVTELIGSGANLVTGDYSRGASGFWIENGELAYPVSEVTLAGNLLDIFKAMEPANDLETHHGTNAPTVLVEGLTLAGK